jgi:hypothetical protein
MLMRSAVLSVACAGRDLVLVLRQRDARSTAGGAAGFVQASRPSRRARRAAPRGAAGACAMTGSSSSHGRPRPSAAFVGRQQPDAQRGARCCPAEVAGADELRDDVAALADRLDDVVFSTRSALRRRSCTRGRGTAGALAPPSSTSSGSWTSTSSPASNAARGAGTSRCRRRGPPRRRAVRRVHGGRRPGARRAARWPGRRRASSRSAACSRGRSSRPRSAPRNRVQTPRRSTDADVRPAAPPVDDPAGEHAGRPWFHARGSIAVSGWRRELALPERVLAAAEEHVRDLARAVDLDVAPDLCGRRPRRERETNARRAPRGRAAAGRRRRGSATSAPGGQRRRRERRHQTSPSLTHVSSARLQLAGPALDQRRRGAPGRPRRRVHSGVSPKSRSPYAVAIFSGRLSMISGRSLRPLHEAAEHGSSLSRSAPRARALADLELARERPLRARAGGASRISQVVTGYSSSVGPSLRRARGGRFAMRCTPATSASGPCWSSAFFQTPPGPDSRPRSCRISSDVRSARSR